MGRIAIYPAIPSDQGLFICEVARIINDQGHTKVTRKTFAVAVSELTFVTPETYQQVTKLARLVAVVLLGLSGKSQT